MTPRPNNICKSTPRPERPTNEMADKIENSTSVDNSWSFVNLHLPSSTITAVAILVMAIMVWLTFRVYTKYCGLHPPASQAQPAPSIPPTPSTSTPATSVVLDMEHLLNVVAHRPVPALTSNI